MNIDQLVDELWRSIQEGVHEPAALREHVVSLDDAYRVQFGLLERYQNVGARHVGWKIGFTTEALQQQMGIHEPVFGFLLDTGHRTSGSEFVFDSLIAPAMEHELCLTMGEDLAGPNATPEKARAAIAQVAPAFEIIERRQAQPMRAALAVADNVAHKLFITGAPVLLGEHDLAAVGVEVRVNDAVCERAMGAAVMGSPVAAAAWLGNKLAEFGWKLEAGVQVMSGSFTKACPIARGDAYEARFDGIGEVRASFR